MLCCRVVLSCPSGGGRWGGDELESSGAGILVGGRWSSSGIRVSGCSGCLAVGWWGQCGVLRWVEGGLSAVLSAVCTLHPAGSGTSAHVLEEEVGGTESEAPPVASAQPEWVKNRIRPNLAALGKLLLGRVGTGTPGREGATFDTGERESLHLGWVCTQVPTCQALYCGTAV